MPYGGSPFGGAPFGGSPPPGTPPPPPGPGVGAGAAPRRQFWTRKRWMHRSRVYAIQTAPINFLSSLAAAAWEPWRPRQASAWNFEHEHRLDNFIVLQNAMRRRRLASLVPLVPIPIPYADTGPPMIAVDLAPMRSKPR